MKRLLFSYLFILISLFILLYMDTSSISIMLNEQQRQLILFLLDLGLKSNQLQGDEIVMSANYRLVITKACNGIIPIILYISMVWAYPYRKIIDRALWSLLGYVVLTIVDVARILLVVSIVSDKKGRFPLTHDIGGNFIFMVSILSLLALYIRFTKRGV
ncbi:MAG: exosortase/archaeosortase family protein [Sulfurovum sp.]